MGIGKSDKYPPFVDEIETKLHRNVFILTKSFL